MNTTVLTTSIGEVEYKIPDVNGSVKKTDYRDYRVIIFYYFTTSDYNIYFCSCWNTWYKIKKSKYNNINWS